MGGDDLQLHCKAKNEPCTLKKLDASIHAGDFAVVSSVLSFPCVVHLKIFGIYGNEVEFVEQATM